MYIIIICVAVFHHIVVAETFSPREGPFIESLDLALEELHWHNECLDLFGKVLQFLEQKLYGHKNYVMFIITIYNIFNPVDN